MRRLIGTAILLGLGSVASTNARAQTEPASPNLAADPVGSESASLPDSWKPLVVAMQTELERSMTQLRRPNKAAPYYIGYWLVEYEHQRVQAKLGSVIARDQSHQRFIRIELRVGSPDLDNSNAFATGGMAGFRGVSPDMAQAPLDDDPTALRRAFWLLTDSAYQKGVELFEQKKAERESSVKTSPTQPDFSQEQVESTVAENQVTLSTLDAMQADAAAASATFKTLPSIYDAEVTSDAWIVRRAFVSSESVTSYEPSTMTKHTVTVYSQADDGMPIVRTRSLFGGNVGEPLQALATELGNDVRKLREAPVVEDYSGPILFEGEAAAQIAFELLGSTLSGTPSEDGSDSPWLRRLGKRVLPKSVDVFDDPTIDSFRKLPLFGSYAFDDEGVAPSRVNLVERGRLRGFLMSRTPNEHFAKSNGHGRPGLGGWSRGAVGNLIVTSRDGLSKRALRRRLLATVKEEGGSYGLIVKTLERREYSTSGNVPPRPEVLIKLHVDGKEEMVRGAEFHQLSPRDLKDVIATGTTLSAHHFSPSIAGAVPGGATTLAPSLLFEDVEVRRPSLAHELPPVLPRPELDPASN